MNKKVLIGIGVVLAIGAIGFTVWYLSKKKADKKKADETAAKQQVSSDAKNTIVLTETMQAKFADGSEQLTTLPKGMKLIITQSPVVYQIGNGSVSGVKARTESGTEYYIPYIKS